MIKRITTTGTTWFDVPGDIGLVTLRLTYTGSATGAVVVVVSTDKSDTDKTGSLELNGEQVTFDSGGTYKSRYVDISGQKYIGIQVTSVTGTIEAEVIRASK
jgi:hypothetical protein